MRNNTKKFIYILIITFTFILLALWIFYVGFADGKKIYIKHDNLSSDIETNRAGYSKNIVKNHLLYQQSVLSGLGLPLETEISYIYNNSNEYVKSSQNIHINKNYEYLGNQKSYLGEYLINLINGQIYISKNGAKVWQSSTEWWVDSYIIADSDNDGIININMSVWKKGRFGDSMPFWIKQNDMSIKNHFFIYKLINWNMIPVWQSSNLSFPNCEFLISDVNNDGNNELIVVEGNYLKNNTCDGNYVAIWKWNGWGFSNEWRSNTTNYSNLRLKDNFGLQKIFINAF